MIYKVPILLMVLILGGSLIHKYTIGKHHTYVPLFKAKECFTFVTNKHGMPDGMVMYKTDLYYMVLWNSEADKRYAGPKIGNELPIKWLDAYATHATCPKSWLSPPKETWS